VFEVTATRLDEDGQGVGMTGAAVCVHVRDLLPGESARARLVHLGARRNEAWAEIQERTSHLSASRVGPACRAFGRCGGCAWQHLSYDAQLEEKRRIVEEALGPLLAAGVTPSPVRPAPAVLEYRNKAKYVVASMRSRKGPRVVLGAYAPRTHEVVDTLGCRVVERDLDEVARGIRDLLQRRVAVLPPYDPTTHTGAIRYVVLRSGARSEVAVILVVTSEAARDIVGRLASAIHRLPHVACVLAGVQDDRGDVILPPTLAPLAGTPSVQERIGGVDVDSAPASFFQVNRAQASAMYDFVANACADAQLTTALDLYCGVGGFSFALARKGMATLGLEGDPRAVTAARSAATRAGLADRAAFEAADLAAPEALAAAVANARESWGVVVANPPRKGLSAAVRGAIMTLRPPRIVYVSCALASLARDLWKLLDAGYHVHAATPFDLMPGTSQIETVVELRRA
jgi:23S rRNA (uracil1939-C5)-methyltransferase